MHLYAMNRVGFRAKSSPERRRFVISSNARRDNPQSPEGNGKGRTHTATSIAEAEKRLQSGDATPSRRPSPRLT